MAGVSTKRISDIIGNSNLKVIRIMTNIALLISRGSTAIAATNNVPDEDINFIKNVFNSIGYATIIPEDLMNLSIAINGSGPAYIFEFTKAVIDFADLHGMSYDTALNLFANTLIGSAELMLSKKNDINGLIKMVSSPGGTTLAALNSFDKNNYNGIISEALDSCLKRAYELDNV